MKLHEEKLSNGHTWCRIANSGWRNPLDPQFAAQRGGRWNSPGGRPTLYLNEDLATARLNLRLFIAQWPYEPEDLRSDTGPHLVGAQLLRNQVVADVHTRVGLAQAGLYQNYPHDLNGDVVAHEVCQAIGEVTKSAGLRGVRARSAQSRDSVARELAWFPAGERSRAKHINTLKFEKWC